MKTNKVDWKKGLILTVTLTIWLRMLIFAIGYGFLNRFNRLPLTVSQMDYALNIPEDKNNLGYFLTQPLFRFDALWYKEIALHGYREDPMTTAFSPGFPFLVNFLGNITGAGYGLVAFILTTFLGGGVFFLLYMVTAMDEGEKTAVSTLYIYSFFPTAFFLFMPYAESLLIFLTLFSIYFAKKGKEGLSLIPAALGSMVKPYGIIVLAVILALLMKGKDLKGRIWVILFSLISPLSILLVIRYQGNMSMNPFGQMTAQSLWGAKIPAPLNPLVKQLNFFTANPFDLANFLYLFSVIGLLFFLYKTYKKINYGYWGMSLIYFLVFYLFSQRENVLGSMSRYILIIFPFYIWLAKVKAGEWIKTIYISTSLVLFALSFIYYTFGFFIA